MPVRLSVKDSSLYGQDVSLGDKLCPLLIF